ncbi:hypothetical protein [Gordonia aurantiaca]
MPANVGDELTEGLRDSSAAVAVATDDRAVLRDLDDWPRPEPPGQGVS